jgi:DNA helicase-2/ATP-dependent DNA helicase PcrA
MPNLDTAYDIDHRTQAFENHERGILVCLAGPGTGKTFSLLARSAALGARGCDQESICYLTFIKEISRAFIDDYIQKFGEEAYLSQAPRISTLHSFGCRLLRNQGFRLGYDGDLHFANLADSDDAAETFLGDLLPIVTSGDCRTVPQLRAVLKTIKDAWQNASDPLAAPVPAPAILPVLLDVARCFRLVDWDQAIPLASHLFAALDPLPEWLAKIKHYFVDEYQDFNRAEQAFVSQLELCAESMVIVGDDDQSLYSGRGGSPEGILNLYETPEHDQVTLAKCYRCKANIVTPTNRFQAYMSATPRPMTPAAAGGQVVSYRFKSSKAEVAFLATYLRQRLDELPENAKPKDGVVCLFPSKRVLNCYFELLAPHVPCVRRGVETSSLRTWMERVLELLLRPDQRFLQRLLLNDYVDIKPRHRARIVQRVVERNISPAHACESLLADGEFTAKALIAARAFVDDCAHLTARDIPKVSQFMAVTLAIPKTTVAEQLSALMAVEESERTDKLDSMCDALLPETVPAATDPRAVQFLTMHGSKGLTRKTVVLPGLEEACLPATATAADLPERRRLFFVALSRATDNLLLSFPLHRGGTDSLNFPMPGRGVESSFLVQAGLSAVYHP